MRATQQFFMAIIAVVGLSSQAFGQDQFEVFLRAGINNTRASAHIPINNGEAYLTGTDYAPTAFLYGIEAKLNLNEKWAVRGTFDVSSSYNHDITIFTNRYVFDYSANIREVRRYRFAPLFLNTTLERNFKLSKLFSVSPRAGLGLRVINQTRVETIDSNTAPLFKHTETIGDAFDDSFNSIDGFMNFGTNFSYKKYYLDITFRISMTETANSEIVIEDETYLPDVKHNFLSCSIGYKIWGKD